MVEEDVNVVYFLELATPNQIAKVLYFLKYISPHHISHQQWQFFCFPGYNQVKLTI